MKRFTTRASVSLTPSLRTPPRERCNDIKKSKKYYSNETNERQPRWSLVSAQFLGILSFVFACLGADLPLTSAGTRGDQQTREGLRAVRGVYLHFTTTNHFRQTDRRKSNRRQRRPFQHERSCITHDGARSAPVPRASDEINNHARCVGQTRCVH